MFLLGARPEWQGRGLGSALLQHLNSIADAKGMHCYLEVRAPSAATGAAFTCTFHLYSCMKLHAVPSTTGIHAVLLVSILHVHALVVF